MAPPLEDWSFGDHLRFLSRAGLWLIGAMLIAGGLSWFTARGQTVTRADALLQLGYNPITGWIEPPNELVARLGASGLLADVDEGRPAAGVPTLSAKQIPNSGFVRVRGASGDAEAMRWTMERALEKVLAEHEVRAARAAAALERRSAQLDADIARLKAALELPHDDSPEMVTERLRILQRLGKLERERDDLRPDVKIASPRATRLVQPVAYVTAARGTKQAIYGAVAGLLLALTLLYLREGLRSVAEPAGSSIDKV